MEGAVEKKNSNSVTGKGKKPPAGRERTQGTHLGQRKKFKKRLKAIRVVIQVSKKPGMSGGRFLSHEV